MPALHDGALVTDQLPPAPQDTPSRNLVDMFDLDLEEPIGLFDYVNSHSVGMDPDFIYDETADNTAVQEDLPPHYVGPAAVSASIPRLRAAPLPLRPAVPATMTAHQLVQSVPTPKHPALAGDKKRPKGTEHGSDTSQKQGDDNEIAAGMETEFDSPFNADKEQNETQK